MTMARAHLVDLSVTRWYHCVARCVRGASLLGEGALDRKGWMENRLEELAQIFAISVAGYSVLDDQLHVLARLDPESAAGWSNEEVVRRWGRVVPPRDKARQPIPVDGKWVRGQLKAAATVATARERLQSLSWFMKSLKEPLARMANREDETRNAFFESRFKSIAILDEESLLATCVSIDLNPVAAGLAAGPETSAHTSIRQRVAHIKAHGRLTGVKAGGRRSVAGVERSPGLEESHWLCPIEDRRGIDSTREGMFAGITPGDYVLLVKYTGRLLRKGQASIPREVAALFDRLGTNAETWQARLTKLSEGRLLGRFFAASRERLREVAENLGVRHLDNLDSCPTR